MRINLTFFLLVLLGTIKPLLSQNFGLEGGLGFSRVEGDFRQFQAIQDSIPFVGSGSALNYNFALLFNLPINKSIFVSNTLGIQYASTQVSAIRDLSARFDTSLPQSRYVLKMDGKFQLKMLKLSFSPSLNYKVFNNFFVKSGFTIGYNFLVPKTIDYIEDVYIKGFSFVSENNQFQTEGKHNLPITFTFDFGLHYKIPQNFFGLFKIALLPYFSFGFCNITKDFTSDYISLGLYLAFIPEKIEKKKEQIKPLELPPIDSLLPQPIEPKIVSEPQPIEKRDSLEIQFVGVNREGTTEVYSPAVISISKEIFEMKAPLLNFVFFEYGKSELPKRYNILKSYENFNYKILKDRSFLEVYSDILNIIGYRLRKNPKAKVTIVGCNSNLGEEKENLVLSRLRANNVAKYLTQVWEIEPERIKIEARNLPENPSNPKIPEGNSENQRVEILSDDPEILAPFTLLDTAIYFSPDYLRVITKISSEQTKLNCKVVLPVTKIDTLQVSLSVPKDSFDLQISSLVNLISNFLPVVDIQLIFSKPEQAYEIQRRIISLPISAKSNFVNSQEKEKLVLPPFNFNSSELNKNQIEFLTHFKSKFVNAKKITLFGYTDIVGDDEYNKRLSHARVNSVEEFLSNHILNQNQIASANDVNSIFNKEAVGETKTLFDNKIPEGRFFSRTVEILIEY